ncbi:MAG: PilZ domain-containing protein [Brevinematia bacterium]
MSSSENVVNIMKFFVSSGKEVVLIIDDLKVKGSVVRMDDVYFYLKPTVLPDVQKFPYGVSCLIPYGKDLFFFNSETVKIEGDEICVMLPTSIVKKHHREYERYNVEGMLFASLNFVKEIDDKDFINRFPLAMRSMFAQGLSSVSYEDMLGKAIEILSAQFGAAVFIEEFSQLPWLKYCRYNRVGLIVPDMESGKFLEPMRVYGFASYGFFLEPQRRNILDAEVKVFVNYHTFKGFRAYIYVPIFVVDTLLGYIMIGSNETISTERFEDISKLMRILGIVDLVEQFFCYNRFFVLNEHRDYPIPVIDISFGGVKIKIDKHISYFINVGDTVKLYFKIGGKFFEFIGEVIRVGYEGGNFISAIKFLNMDKSEFLVIKRWFGGFERW